MQQHYLPKGAYLKFFEVPHKPGAVYLYQREKDIVLTGIHNVAKEKHLYSFTDMEGKLNTTLEAMLGEFECCHTNPHRTTVKLGPHFRLASDEFNTLMSFLQSSGGTNPSISQNARAGFGHACEDGYAGLRSEHGLIEVNYGENEGPSARRRFP